ncbi:MAG: lysostaphin resistance A-like protein [Hyphomonas sp.]|jgi:membrane protease YdiL (CAAX protease family)
MQPDTSEPGAPQTPPIARMWMSALFWSMAALVLLPWLITELSFLHEAAAPAMAEAVWAPWWYNDHPLSQVVWGLVMLACGAGLWVWLGQRGVRQEAAPRGDLGPLIILLIFAAVAFNWFAYAPIDYIALQLTGQEELPVEKPGYETSYAPETLPGELFSAVIAAPLFEELAFRGFLLSVLLARGWPVWGSITVVAALFAATHEQYYLSGQISVFVLGVLMGGLRIASGGIAAPILAHALSNLIVTLYNYGLEA